MGWRIHTQHCKKATHPRCDYGSDLFIDGEPLLHVGSAADVKEGSWFFDYDNKKIIFGDDPAGKTVELSVTNHAFGVARKIAVAQKKGCGVDDL